MKLPRSRFTGLYLFALVFVVVSLLLRTALLVRSLATADTRLGTVCLTYAIGLGMDLVACAACGLPVTLLLILAPDRVIRGRAFHWIGAGLYAVAVGAVFYVAAVEWFFWDEFETRFNFLAIDYLQHTREVFGNIWESYPVVPVTLGIVAVAAGTVAATVRAVWRSYDTTSTFGRRLRAGAVLLAVAAPAPVVMGSTVVRISPSPTTNALARNGALCFVAAMLEATLDYKQVYLVRDDREVFARLRELLATDDSRFVSDDVFDLTRDVVSGRAEKRHNVVLVVVESLSADLLGAFGNTEGLTPNLDALAREGLLFKRMYATGTRTIRGLEAINFSLPPGPGRAVAKRRDADRFFSAERIFRAKGYRTKFIYGGDLRFDSMRFFIERGGFETIDRGDLTPAEITHANVWGVCDQDLFRRAVLECDDSHASAKPFLTVALTTSNHMPNTYPQVIDIPSGTGPAGGVKYSDYAIGEFIERARARPWFGDTIFVIVADHCARIRDKGDVAAVKYHIPALFYAPKLIPPAENDALCSQADLAPTLLGMLGMSAQSIAHLLIILLVIVGNIAYFASGRGERRREA